MPCGVSFSIQKKFKGRLLITIKRPDGRFSELLALHAAHQALVVRMFQVNPLVRFSIYTDIQVEVVKRLSSEILELLDKSFSADTIDGHAFQRVYGLFWLWVIGTYEIVRTMSEYPDCFSENACGLTSAFKKRIAVLRVPFAKQQFQGRERRPISNENSIYGIDRIRRDMSFCIGDQVLSVRALMAEFDNFISSIAESDVLRDMRESEKS